MNLSKLEARLYDALCGLEIVDAHEHLPPEKEYLAFHYCGPNFFAGYVWHDLASAGLPLEVKNTLRDPGPRRVEDWWPKLSPYWNAVKDGSYARAARITARDLYGIEEINDSTIHLLAERISADNTPGLYHRILREKCNIRVALTNQPHTRFQDDPLLKPVVSNVYEPQRWTWDDIQSFAANEGTEIKSLDDLLDANRKRLQRLKSEGAVGFKLTVTYRSEPSQAEARATFDRIKSAGCCDNAAPLADYVLWECLKWAGEIGKPEPCTRVCGATSGQ